MSYLFQYLPPFAADYSGVASALHDLGGLVVIHDASGCTGSFTGYDEPRWFSGKSSVYCSGLREFDAIAGNDDRLLGNIRSAVDARDFNFAALIGSPVPMLVGFDFDGFARMGEAELHLPFFGFPMTGFARYERGLSAAFLALAERFVEDPRCLPVGANILGVSPLDNFDAKAVEIIAAFLEKNGFPVVSVWGQGDEWRSIPKAARAKINFVAAASALPLAEYMENRWGIPYVAGLPLGAKTEAELENRMRHRLDARSRLPRRGDQGAATIFLIGEQFRMNALRAELLERHPLLEAMVGSFFAWDLSFADEGDCFISNEAEAIRHLAQGDFDLVVGDPLLRELMPDSSEKHFVAEAHYAISARLYREHVLSRRFGSALADFLDEIAERAFIARACRSERLSA
ncbi:MAG: hypothetical protein LBJ76_02355 [Candidatus Accumulibacter sp.]|nr:hypothetical protein [Accumulibacter sp.]